MGGYGTLAPYGGGASEGYDGAPLVLDGHYFTPRPIWSSFLYALPGSIESYRTGVRQLRQLGFNGLRVFAGALGQVGQTPQLALAHLPDLLTVAAEEGAFVQVCAITNSGSEPYDIGAHLESVSAICARFPNSLLEVANEPYHATQNATCHNPNALLALATVHAGGLSYALGAAAADELDSTGHYAYQGGAWNTAHLDRGRDFWNRVRRVKELWEIGQQTGRPIMSGEPIGAAPVSDPGKRESDPLWFYTYGLLCRAFDVGCIFHSDQGLNATPLSGVELDCALACLAGFTLWPSAERLRFFNAGWPNSPVADADFSKVVRAYSFVTNNSGFTALLGVEDGANIQWSGGWTPAGILSEQRSANGTLQVVALQRG